MFSKAGDMIIPRSPKAYIGLYRKRSRGLEISNTGNTSFTFNYSIKHWLYLTGETLNQVCLSSIPRTTNTGNIMNTCTESVLLSTPKCLEGEF